MNDGRKLALLTSSIPALPADHVLFLSEWTAQGAATVSYLWVVDEEVLPHEVQVWEPTRYAEVPHEEVLRYGHLPSDVGLKSSIESFVEALSMASRTPTWKSGPGADVSPKEIASAVLNSVHETLEHGWRQRPVMQEDMGEAMGAAVTRLGFIQEPSWQAGLLDRVHAFG